MHPILVANWKMNGSSAMAQALVPAVASFAAARGVSAEIVICPPAILVPAVAQAVRGSFLAVGAQDCSAQPEGAYTGEISAPMLAEAGCRYVIVGHSERRQYHAETDLLVHAKAQAAMAAGLVPIICVGETQAEREAGKALEVVEKQLRICLPGSQPLIPNPHFLLAYEPVWAIGSGLVPTLDDIKAMHAHIAVVAGAGVVVLYGGSVKAANAASILQVPGVGGLLVGGASLKAEEFCGIIAASER